MISGGSPADTQGKYDAEISMVERHSPSLSMKEKTLAYGGDDALPSPPVLTEEEERRLWRRVDLHIMPYITLMYLCSFVDRSNIGACVYSVRDVMERWMEAEADFCCVWIGNAKLQGLTTQLGLIGNQYNIALVSMSSQYQFHRHS